MTTESVRLLSARALASAGFDDNSAIYMSEAESFVQLFDTSSLSFDRRVSPYMEAARPKAEKAARKASTVARPSVRPENQSLTLWRRKFSLQSRTHAQRYHCGSHSGLHALLMRLAWCKVQIHVDESARLVDRSRSSAARSLGMPRLRRRFAPIAFLPPMRCVRSYDADP